MVVFSSIGFGFGHKQSPADKSTNKKINFNIFKAIKRNCSHKPLISL